MRGSRAVWRGGIAVVGGIAALMAVISPAVAGVDGPAGVRCSTKPVQPSITARFSELAGVAVASACDAWAVGYTQAGLAKPEQALALHWDGRSWRSAVVPGAAGSEALTAVAFESGGRAWAVGYGPRQDGTRALILLWNGRSWRRVPCPVAGTSSSGLESVVAASPDSAWAVGWAGAGALVMHWDGRRWAEVPGPGLATSLQSVAVAPRGTVWMIGSFTTYPQDEDQSQILEYSNGRQDGEYDPPLSQSLQVVASASLSRVWAVGSEAVPASSDVQPLILMWNGSTWQKQAVPAMPGTQVVLAGLTVASPRNAWAVGDYRQGKIFKTLVLHWNGASWLRLRSRNPAGAHAGDDSFMTGVAGRSCATIWAVGVTYTPSAGTHAVTYRC